MKGLQFSNPLKLVLSFTVALTLGFSGVGAPGELGQAHAQAANKRIVINIPSRTLWVYEGERIAEWYPVGVGRPGFQTPLGEYKVLRKIVNPIWEHPYKAAGAVRIKAGPNNPLGTRWIGFKEYKGGEYGIHGTDNPSSVGKFSSHGCVRMKIKDAEALYKQVELGTPVEVTYQTVLVRPQGEQMRLVVYPDAFSKGMPNVAEVREMILKQYPKASVDETLISQALRNPTQSPVVVGQTDGSKLAGSAAAKPPAEVRNEVPAGLPEANLKLNYAPKTLPFRTRKAGIDKPPPPVSAYVLRAEQQQAAQANQPASRAVTPLSQLQSAVYRDFSGRVSQNSPADSVR